MITEYYRTFIALPVSAGNPLISARDELRDALSGERISWVDPRNYHVTLSFLGDTDIETIRAVRECLERELKLPLLPDFQLKGPDSFGPRKKPRVIWMGFEQAEGINLFKQEVDRALEQIGLAETDQPFRAHLTLGRVRSLKKPDRYYEVLREMKTTFTDSVKLDREGYYKSVPGESGPIYTALAEWSFEG